MIIYLRKRKQKKGGDNLFNEKELRAQLVRKGISIKELSRTLGINESTFYRKMKSNGAFTRDEINIMIEILSIEDPMNIFFAEELA